MAYSIVWIRMYHSCATRCVESGCDCKTLSAILGHSSVSITLNLYVHPDFKQKQKCIDKVFNIFPPCLAQNVHYTVE